MQEQPLLDLFADHQLDYILHTHVPVFTVESSSDLHNSIPGAHSKNLFLKDKKKAFFLLSVLDHKRVDLKALAKNFGKGGFSFAGSEELAEHLQLLPGSVTPYGLINSKMQKVNFLLDQDFLNFATVNFHPLRNDMTIEIATPLFLRFFEIIQHVPNIIEVPTL